MAADLNFSIHPRNWPNSPGRDKSNTCAPRATKRRALRAIPGLERHIAEHPKDVMALARLAKLQAVLSE